MTTDDKIRNEKLQCETIYAILPKKQQKYHHFHLKNWYTDEKILPSNERQIIKLKLA